MKMKLSLLFIVSILLLIVYSCVRDTDFNQAEDVVWTPEVELNLIHFNIDAGRFYDEVTSTEILTVRDTTEIRFLDDHDIQEGLVRADFYLRFTNSIPRDFLVNFRFLSELNDTTYVFQTLVDPGTISTPVVTEHTEIVIGEDVVQLTMANKVVVTVSLPSSSPDLEGSLNLQSKTTYYLEI